MVRSGRTFVRRLIERSKRAKHNNQYIKLDQSTQADIKWWLHYLPKWNGVSLFMDDRWTDSVDIDLYTDASDLAIGGYFDGMWFSATLDTDQKKMSINW